ncbi:MAG: nucleotide exchange factor GrpE [Muribaculaceae bacterium]|nr:nucleotide exchange factor GrpE [Muribaculaceae bacterium]
MSKNKSPKANQHDEKENLANEDVEIKNVDTEEQEQEVEIEKDETTILQEENEKLKAQLEKEKKEYLFLLAEFDNFRKRTLKEKAEIIKNGAENAMKNLLPIIDDFERGIQAMDESNDTKAVKEGIDLIYTKFIKYLDQNGVKAITTDAGNDFDTELHEAVTTFPAPKESLKNKIIDTVQRGYTLNDKVLRHAKVVVGQ